MKIRGYNGDIIHIDHASLYIDVSSMVYNNTTQYALVYEDGDGTEFKTENSIFADYETVSVRNNVYDVITLGVNVILPKTDGNYTVRLVNSEFTEIKAGIKATNGRGAEFADAYIDGGELAEGTNEYTATLTEPDGIYLPEDKKQMTVEIEMLKTEQEPQ